MADEKSSCLQKLNPFLLFPVPHFRASLRMHLFFVVMGKKLTVWILSRIFQHQVPRDYLIKWLKSYLNQLGFTLKLFLCLLVRESVCLLVLAKIFKSTFEFQGVSWFLGLWKYILSRKVEKSIRYERRRKNSIIGYLFTIPFWKLYRWEIRLWSHREMVQCLYISFVNIM